MENENINEETNIYMEELKKNKEELEIKKTNLITAIKEIEYEIEQAKQNIYKKMEYMGKLFIFANIAIMKNKFILLTMRKN